MPARCRGDVAVAQARPAFKTIADFRRDNGPAIVGVCGAFVLVCRDVGLFAARLIALDGSKFRAAASPKKVIGREEVAEEGGRLERRIAAYLSGLDEADVCETDDEPDAVPAALAALYNRRAELDRMAHKLDAEERTTLVESEEDARPMRAGRGHKPPCYNVRTTVDADTGLIVHHEVTDGPTDRRHLHPVASATRESLDLEALTVVADKASTTASMPAPASGTASSPACPHSARSTTKATARCSTAPPSSTSRRRTPSPVRRAVRWCASNFIARSAMSPMPRRTVPAAP